MVSVIVPLTMDFLRPSPDFLIKVLVPTDLPSDDVFSYLVTKSVGNYDHALILYEGLVIGEHSSDIAIRY